MTTPFERALRVHADLPEDAQKQAGKAIGGDMNANAQAFLESLLRLVESGEINPKATETFLNRDVYNKLREEDRDKIDLALMNLQHLLEDILEFRFSPQTPDSSPHLETMIMQLLDMKQRIEAKAGDVFKF